MSVSAKADRLLLASRVEIRCEEGALAALVQGDHDLYRLTLTLSGWRCPCPARIATCAHVAAVETVTGWRP